LDLKVSHAITEGLGESFFLTSYWFVKIHKSVLYQMTVPELLPWIDRE
jgi:hypothetical protein